MNEEKREAIVIINPKIARELLKLGHRIIDIKPHNAIKYATVFIFEIDENIINDKNRLIYDLKNKIGK